MRSLFEVNTLVWVRAWSAKTGRRLTLATMPAAAWDKVCLPGIDGVWLMGVWERSPAGARIGMASLGVPPEDVVGSPYCIRRYEPEEWLGGREGLAAARTELARRGYGLVLDFVPNHVAPDHPWVEVRPELFIHEPDGSVAGGRDPYFSPWPDVLQLDVFRPEVRAAAASTLVDIGEQCDGVRCDMAMLVLNDVFAATWGLSPPATEYWDDVLAIVRAWHPGMTFIAEVYWDLEWRLLELGFDACYDKRLYDRLAGRDADGVRAHLAADVDFQRRLVRFTENHDEARAAVAFGAAARAAAVAVATLPGTTLWHEGQAEGHTVHLPVQVGRRPDEGDDLDSQGFHRALWRLAPEVRRGWWALAPTSGWESDSTHRQLLAWTWAVEGQLRWVVVVNYGDRPAAGRIQLPPVEARTVRLNDRLTNDAYERAGAELGADGLLVVLGPWQQHVLELE